MGKIKKYIILAYFVILTSLCHAQSRELLYNELHFEDGLCLINIVGTPIEIIRSTWIDTSCFHREQPISMLSFLYKGQDYTFYIDYNLEKMVDSIISWVDKLHPIEISVLFFQSCAEPYVLNDMFYPLGIITHVRPYILDGVTKPSYNCHPLKKRGTGVWSESDREKQR